MANADAPPSYAGVVIDELHPDPDENLTDYSEDGVDLTLIRWMLSLSPEERLKFHNDRIIEIEAIRKMNGI